MRLPGAAGQVNSGERVYDASGTITSGSAAQLLLPIARSRSMLAIENISSSALMYIEIGGARASATLTGTSVSAVAVTNAGFGFTLPPTVEFLGGAYDNKNQITPSFSLVGLPEFPSPTAPNGRPARAHCVMTGSAGSLTVSSIVIDDPGLGYAYPPYVYLRNSPSDPFGAANPFNASTASGILLNPAGSYSPNGTICTTDQVAIYSATAGAAFTVKWSI